MKTKGRIKRRKRKAKERKKKWKKEMNVWEEKIESKGKLIKKMKEIRKDKWK